MPKIYILHLQKNGITDDTTRANTLTALVAQESAKIIPTNYTLNDIHIAPSESKDSIRFYGNTISLLLQKVATKNDIENELKSINSYTQTKNTSDLSFIIKNKNNLDILIQKVLNISVPPSAVAYHILFLNRLALYRDTLDNISKADTDPVRSLVGADKYVDVVVLAIRTLPQFSTYFNNKNIVFSAKDAGYVFTTGYTNTN